MTLPCTSYKVPLLDDVLEIMAGRVPILVEVKSGSLMDRTGPALLRSLSSYSGPVAVQSFDPRVIMWMKKNAPHVIRGQISSAFSDAQLPAIQKWLLRSMLLNVLTRPQFIAFNIDAMPSVFVSLWRSNLRVPFLLWIVRTREQVREAQRYHANMIFEEVRPILPA